MARPRSKIKEFCQNEKGSYYHKEKGNDIIMRSKNLAGHQRYFCFHCNKYFVKTKGTPMYQRRMSERKVKAICKELVEKRWTAYRDSRTLMQYYPSTETRLTSVFEMGTGEPRPCGRP